MIFIFVINDDLYAQKSVFYYRNVGFDTLTLYDDQTFKSHGGSGLAGSIEYSGQYKASNDTIILIKKTPIIINKLDTNYQISANDTLLIIDELTLVYINFNNYEFYKLVEKYENNKLTAQYSWTYSNEIVKSRLIYNYPIKHGPEIHFDNDGIILKKYLWENGKLKDE
jgi:hypothetical protein